MLLLLAIALLLRLPFLTQSLWLDEAIEALALKGYYGPLSTYSLSDFQPPLYHYLLKVWTNLAGYSELALRTPSLVAGVALVAVTYKLGERLHSQQVGLIAGLLVTTNPLLIYYSQEGRTYMLTTLFVTLSFYHLVRLLKNKNTPVQSAIYYVLSTIAILWTSYLACFVVLLQLGYLLYLRRFDLARLTLLALISLLPWVLPFTRSLALGLGDATASPEWGKVVGGISGKALALTFVKAAVGRISFSPPWFYAGVVVTIFVTHAYILTKLKRVPSVLWLWLSSLIFAGLISFWVPAYSYTRVLFVVPCYLLLLSLALVWANSKLLYFAPVAIQLVCLVVFWFTPRFHREDWRGLVNYLNAQTGLVMMPSLDQSPPLVYYHLSLPLKMRPDSGESRPIYYIRYAEELFDQERTGPTSLENSGYTIIKELSFTGIPLVIYENRP